MILCVLLLAMIVLTTLFGMYLILKMIVANLSHLITSLTKQLVVQTNLAASKDLAAFSTLQNLTGSSPEVVAPPSNFDPNMVDPDVLANHLNSYYTKEEFNQEFGGLT